MDKKLPNKDSCRKGGGSRSNCSFGPITWLFVHVGSLASFQGYDSVVGGRQGKIFCYQLKLALPKAQSMLYRVKKSVIYNVFTSLIRLVMHVFRYLFHFLHI